MRVIDVKPKNGFVSSIKPTLGGVIDVLPRLSKVYGEVIRWKSTGRGMPIGLLLTLTYPCDERI